MLPIFYSRESSPHDRFHRSGDSGSGRLCCTLPHDDAHGAHATVDPYANADRHANFYTSSCANANCQANHHPKRYTDANNDAHTNDYADGHSLTDQRPAGADESPMADTQQLSPCQRCHCAGLL